MLIFYGGALPHCTFNLAATNERPVQVLYEFGLIFIMPLVKGRTGHCDNHRPVVFLFFLPGGCNEPCHRDGLRFRPRKEFGGQYHCHYPDAH